MSVEFDRWIDAMWDKFPSGFTLILVEAHPSREKMAGFLNSLRLQNPVLEGFPGVVAIAGDLSTDEIYDSIIKAEKTGIKPNTQAFGDTAMSNLREALKRTGGFTQFEIKP